MSSGLILSSFIAGLITFFAPCTFPLLPVYLSIIGGDSNELSEKDRTSSSFRIKVIANSLMYILGFSLVFVLFGIFAGYIGQLFPDLKDWLSRLGGIIVIFFGLNSLGLFKVDFLTKTLKFNPGGLLKPGSARSSFILGLSVATGWSPCVGPIVGSILLLASTNSTALEGGFLLLVFSAGIAVPFLLFAILFGSAKLYLKSFSKLLKLINLLGGIMMLLLGVFLVTNRFSQLIGFGFTVLEFLGLNNIINYL